MWLCSLPSRRYTTSGTTDMGGNICNIPPLVCNVSRRYTTSGTTDMGGSTCNLPPLLWDMTCPSATTYMKKIKKIMWWTCNMNFEKCNVDCENALRLVVSSKLQVSFAKEPCKRNDMLQKRPIILRSLLHVDKCTRTHYTLRTMHHTMHTTIRSLFKIIVLFCKRAL